MRVKHALVSPTFIVLLGGVKTARDLLPFDPCASAFASLRACLIHDKLPLPAAPPMLSDNLSLPPPPPPPPQARRSSSPSRPRASASRPTPSRPSSSWAPARASRPCAPSCASAPRCCARTRARAWATASSSSAAGGARRTTFTRRSSRRTGALQGLAPSDAVVAHGKAQKHGAAPAHEAAVVETKLGSAAIAQGARGHGEGARVKVKELLPRILGNHCRRSIGFPNDAEGDRGILHGSNAIQVQKEVRRVRLQGKSVQERHHREQQQRQQKKNRPSHFTERG